MINLGDLSFKLKDVSAAPEREWRPKYAEVFEKPALYPSQSVFVSIDDKKLLVDAGDYSRFASDSEYVPPNYEPPPKLAGQLSQIGVAVEDVTHLVITHAHYDHYAGVTRKVGEIQMPTFKKARHFLGKRDWESNDMKKALADPKSPESESLGVVSTFNLLEPVDGNMQLSREMGIIAAHGESPGHQIVRIASKGETFYCLGDMFHHAAEIENPKWMAPWADPKTNFKSRQALIKSAIKENAILAPSHMQVGRLKSSGSRVEFVEEN